VYWWQWHCNPHNITFYIMIKLQIANIVMHACYWNHLHGTCETQLVWCFASAVELHGGGGRRLIEMCFLCIQGISLLIATKFGDEMLCFRGSLHALFRNLL